jgi:hypothetical protein
MATTPTGTAASRRVRISAGAAGFRGAHDIQGLSVFGAVSREAAEAVAGARYGLANLASKSLSPSPDRSRYAVHELLRQGRSGAAQDADLAARVDEDMPPSMQALALESRALFARCDQPGALALIEDDIDRPAGPGFYLAVGNAGSALVEGLWYLHEMRGWYPAA